MVKAGFGPGFAAWKNPANACVTRGSGLWLFPSWIDGKSHPNVACYQLHYTRIFGCHDYSTKLVRFKVFPVCSHSCGQSDFTARFVNVVKSRKCPYSKDLCGLSGTVADEVRTAPKAGALPTALHPVIELFYPAGRILPNVACYQLRYTRLFSLFIRLGVFSQTTPSANRADSRYLC